MNDTTRQYKNRFDEIDAYEKMMGFGPLTDEDRKALDEAVRMVTNLD